MTDDEISLIEDGWPDGDPDRRRLFPHWRVSHDESGYVWERVDSALIGYTEDHKDVVDMHLSDVALMLTIIKELQSARDLCSTLGGEFIDIRAVLGLPAEAPHPDVLAAIRQAPGSQDD